MRGDDMERFTEWIRSLAFYLIFMTMLLNLLPDKKYEKYFRLFTGMLFILLVFRPFTNLTGLEEQIAGVFERITFQNDVKLLKKEIKDADGRRLSRLMDSYRKAVETDLQIMAEGYDIECLTVAAVIDMDGNGTGSGTLQSVDMRVRLKEGNAGGSDALRERRLLANREIVRLKKRIGEYYGLEEGNITIHLESE